ncbi:unnamed protein product [Diabrotica balteata]|uniref:Uncharacterized protein n=1 Tax=Diabrotica balteata TaxID=107213 RepID=A0A9P0GS97_DIABA|nr:unnamed protein product [Diabrotica balteata]
MVVLSMRVKLKKVNRPSTKKIMDTRRPKQDNTYAKTKFKINENLRKVIENNAEILTIDQKWGKIQHALVSVGKKTLKPLREKTKPWMTVELLELMKDRRKHKAKDLDKYKEI